VTVLPMHTDVLLDTDALNAERQALLAQLAAERFGALQVARRGTPYPDEVHAVWHLRRAAELARQVSDAEKRRCASEQGRCSA
jgi:hypothetical protein